MVLDYNIFLEVAVIPLDIIIYTCYRGRFLLTFFNIIAIRNAGVHRLHFCMILSDGFFDVNPSTSKVVKEK